MLKAHEGSTAERAALLGDGVFGGVVLNSPVGGANPDAVMVAARLGGRVVWLPTISSPAHRAAHASPELHAHAGVHFREVPICDGPVVRPEWFEVLDEVAAHDLAPRVRPSHDGRDRRRLRGGPPPRGPPPHGQPPAARRSSAGERSTPEQLVALDARLEVGALADLLGTGDDGDGTTATERLAARYPHELLVFGSDLGHTAYPTFEDGIDAWTRRMLGVFGEAELTVDHDEDRAGADRTVIRVAVLPGDGIGPEVLEGPVAVLRSLAGAGLLEVTGPWPVGASAFAEGGPGPARTRRWRACEAADAIFLGAVGEQPGVALEDYRPELALIGLREHFDLRVSVRRVSRRGLPPLTIVRNLLGGAYGDATTRTESDRLGGGRGRGRAHRDADRGAGRDRLRRAGAGGRHRLGVGGQGQPLRDQSAVAAGGQPGRRRAGHPDSPHATSTAARSSWRTATWWAT